MDDDADIPDPWDNDADPTARGILLCLRMLAEEATALGMPRTLDALQAAITACAAEGDAADGLQCGDIHLHVAGSSRVH